MSWNQDSQGNELFTSTNPAKFEAVNKTATSSWTIPNGTTLSNSYVDLGGKPLVAISIPTGYSGGNITFQACDTATGTYLDVYDANGTLVTITVAGASRIVALTGSAMQALASLRFVKIKCTTNVSADRVITSITKG